MALQLQPIPPTPNRAITELSHSTPAFNTKYTEFSTEKIGYHNGCSLTWYYSGRLQQSLRASFHAILMQPLDNFQVSIGCGDVHGP